MRFSTVQVGERVYMTEVERVSWETFEIPSSVLSHCNRLCMRRLYDN